MIICGYAGTGKSTAAKKIPGVIDLESTPFQKDWKTYVRVAKHMSDNGYIVLMSCHRELREELASQEIPYIVVVPDKGHKKEYKKRYEERGNTLEFIKVQMDNWEKWVATDGPEHYIILETTPSGHIETMTDLLDEAIRYGWNVFPDDLIGNEY